MTYINSFSLVNVRNIKPLEVKGAPDKTLKHIIITGRNGSGKTTTLKALRDEISLLKTYDPSVISIQRRAYEDGIKRAAQLDFDLREVEVGKVNKKYATFAPQRVSLDFVGAMDASSLVVYFDSKRMSSPVTPKGPTVFAKVEPKEIMPTAGAQIVQFLVNLWTEKAYANVDGDVARVSAIDEWFFSFTNHLKILFEDEDLRLDFDRQIFNFWVRQEGKLPYSLGQLSDGMSSVFSIVSELIVRMQESEASVSFDRPGIVFIDEVETHLHVSLQKLILPFLIGLFPNVQFIVTTHSPFVLTSLANATILDLGAQEVFSDFSGYSYEAIVEEFYGQDKYSFHLKSQIQSVESALGDRDYERAVVELERILNTTITTPNFFENSPELAVKVEELKLRVKSLRS